MASKTVQFALFDVLPEDSLVPPYAPKGLDFGMDPLLDLPVSELEGLLLGSGACSPRSAQEPLPTLPPSAMAVCAESAGQVQPADDATAAATTVILAESVVRSAVARGESHQQHQQAVTSLVETVASPTAARPVAADGFSVPSAGASTSSIPEGSTGTRPAFTALLSA